MIGCGRKRQPGRNFLRVMHELALDRVWNRIVRLRDFRDRDDERAKLFVRRSNLLLDALGFVRVSFSEPEHSEGSGGNALVVVANFCLLYEM